MDEAEQQLADLDDPDPEQAHPEPEETRVLPASDPDAPTEVRIELNSGSEIEIVGNAGALEPYVEGPHSVRVRDLDGVFEVEGQLGDDGLLVIPADVDLSIEANAASLSLSGIRGSLVGELNVGDADIRAAFTRGRSRIDANVGDLHVVLHPDSNVRIQVLSATSIHVSEELVKIGRGVWTYGDGDAGLEITGHIGQIVVDVEVDIDEPAVAVDLTDISAP